MNALERKAALTLAAGLTLYGVTDLADTHIFHPVWQAREDQVNARYPAKWADQIDWAERTKKEVKAFTQRDDVSLQQIADAVQTDEAAYAYFIVWDNNLNEQNRTTYKRELRTEFARPLTGKAHNLANNFNEIGTLLGVGVSVVGGLKLLGAGIRRTATLARQVYADRAHARAIKRFG